MDFPSTWSEAFSFTLPQDTVFILPDSIYINLSKGFIGKGTEESPFLVYSSMTLGNVERYDSEGYYYKQIQDIIRVSSFSYQTSHGRVTEELYSTAELGPECIYDGDGHTIEATSYNGDNQEEFFFLSGEMTELKNTHVKFHSDQPSECVCLASGVNGLMENCSITGTGQANVSVTSWVNQNGEVKNCFSRSENGAATIVEEGEDTYGTIRNSYSIGTFVGGITGTMGTISPSAQIINCYSVAYVKSDDPQTSTNYSFVRYEESPLNILHCYYNVETSPYSGVWFEPKDYTLSDEYSDVPNKVEGKTTAELKQQSTYVDWGFGNDADNPWQIDPSRNDGYPYLYWEKQ